MARVLHQAVIVSLWKKKGDRSDLDNHRGICLIPVFSRLLAKVIASRLSDFCEREQVFDEGQWGFRPLRSTIGAIGTVRRPVDMATRPNALKDTSAGHRASRHEEGLPEQQQECFPTCIGL